MSAIQIIAAFAITIIWVLRSLNYKLVAGAKISGSTVTFAISFWMALGILLSLPLFYNQLVTPLFNNWPALAFPVLVSLSKSVILYYIVKLTASLSKASASSATFAANVALPFGGILNALLFSEQLSLSQITALILMGISAVLYFSKGHIKSTSKQNQQVFLLLIILFLLNMLIDKFVISKTNWYFHLLISNFAWFLIGLPKFLKNFKTEIKNISQKWLVILGLSYTFGEFFLMYSMQHLLGVSMSFLFMRMATPISMMLFAIFYKEGKLKTQLGFGLASLLIATLVIFNPF